MSAWSLYCTVCNGHFERPEWLPHLLGEEHQEIARLEVVQEWNKKKVKKRVLVVFSSFPVGDSEAILRFFEVAGNTLVTDFVWWRERPRMALAQFESKKKLNQVLSNLLSDELGEGSELWIDNQLVQFVKAVDMLGLEWKALLPPSPEEYVKEENTTLKLSGIKVLEGGQLEPAVPHNYENIDPLFSQLLAQFQRSLEVTTDKVPLVKQLLQIFKTVEISDAEFGRGEELRRKVEQVISRDFSACQVRMFRHWYLKLRNPHDPGRLLLFAYQPGAFNFTSVTLPKDVMTDGKLQYCSSLLDARGRRYYDAGLELELGLVTEPAFMVETQLCRLYKYLLTFHPLAYPLLALVYYWTAVNQVHFGDSNKVTKLTQFTSSFKTPPPASMEWLVMMFLCGEKLVPTPRTVLQRPHSPFLVCQSRDIGFSADIQYPQEWRSSRSSEHVGVKDLLKLGLKFFSFWAKLGSQSNIILNTRDAEIIPIEVITGGQEDGNGFQTRLEEEETDQLKGTLERYGYLKSMRLYMTNPLVIHKRLDICGGEFLDIVCPMMADTAGKLEEFLEGGEKNCLLQALHVGSSKPGNKSARKMRAEKRQRVQIKRQKLNR